MIKMLIYKAVLKSMLKNADKLRLTGKQCGQIKSLLEKTQIPMKV